METIMARIEQTHPGEDPGHTILARSLYEQTVGDVKNILVILFGAVGCVLLIACVNVANLLLVRSSERQKEMAIRAALGAGRGRAVTQLLTESILLALIGGLVSMILALWGVDLLRVALADLVPRADEIRLDGAVFGFTLALSLATGLIFGLFPALQISRTDLNAALKDRMSISGERSRLRHGLVVAEVALSLVLLIGAGLMLRSFWRVLEEPPGFRTDHLLLMSISLPNTEYPETAQVVDFYRRLPGLFEDIPGIQAVSAVNALPISGGDSNGMLTVENRTFPPGEEPVTSYRRALPNYFRTIGIPLLRGREFDERDTGEGVKTVIINDLMARRYFPDQDPIGKRIKVGPPEGEPWLEIVGVIGDVRNVGLDSEPALATYEPHAQRSWRTMNMVMRTGVDPSSLIEGVRRRLREQVPNILISDVSVMDQRIADSLGSRRLSLTLLGVFSGVALILALVGVYGVMAYLVTLRTREIGVRMALGAQRIDVMRMIAGKALMLTATGIVVGLAASAAGVTLIADFLYRVSPFDPVTFAVLSFILLVTALLSSYIPARRAARVDPLMALRQE
jgi:putative ABC transport system permease protein